MTSRFLKLLGKPAAKLSRFVDWLFEFALERKGRVKRDGKPLFTMRNYGRTTGRRIVRFATKEPDTLRWIDGFAAGEALLDIGANVGAYTLYAAYRGHKVVAMEPDALNFALLNLNIKDNGFNDRVTAYPFSIHAKAVIAELNMTSYTWGGAHKSFARSLDWQGGAMHASYRQGSAGMSVDEFVEQTGANFSHIKIDVDGNEMYVLEGATRTLASAAVKSVLIELSGDHAEYQRCLDLLQSCGLRLAERAVSDKPRSDKRMVAENHIFVRREGGI